MIFKQVDSSMIQSVAYDTSEQSLYVKFNNGRIYEYFSVPERVYIDLLNAESKGRFFRQEVLYVYDCVCRDDVIEDEPN